MDLTTLKHHRGVVKAALTRAATYVHSLDRATVCPTMLRNKRTMIDASFSKFDPLQEEIEEKVKDNDVELATQIQERDDIEERYLQLVSLIDAIILERSTPPQQPTSNISSVKLPPMNLPSFSGKFEEWTPFMDLYEATIHYNSQLSEVQKLQYLKSIVKDDAASLIKNMPITSSNYSEAWNILKTRYNNEREIVYSHVRKLFQIPAVKTPSAVSIQSVIDQTNECIRALNVLQQPTDEWNVLLVHMTVEKLDVETKRKWLSELQGADIPTFKDLSEFIDKYVRGLQACNATMKPQHERKASSHHISNTNMNLNCGLCGSNHYLYKCAKFLSMSVKDRNLYVKRTTLCFNCLRPSHKTEQCNSSKCRSCNGRHNTLLHFPRESFGPPSSTSAVQPPSTVHHSAESTSKTEVLLSTAVVKVKDGSNEFQQCRLMLDTGSQATLITEQCVQRLGLKRVWDRTTISGVGSGTSHTKGKVKISLYSCIDDSYITVEALIMNKVTSELPRYNCVSEYTHIHGLMLADPTYYLPGTVDILLGAEYTFSVLRHGKIHGPNSCPFAQNTLFGWVLSGRVPVNAVHTLRVNHAVCESDVLLRKFWELEEVPRIKHMTEEERLCEAHFQRTHRRDMDGRFWVELPTTSTLAKLGESREQAERRWKSVERRLSRNPAYKEDYDKFMNEYLALGHMKKVSPLQTTSASPQCYYLPHHFVVKPDSTTTKFRVVFDASAKTTTGVSLNNCLMVGPTVQEDIFSLLLRFRSNKTAFKADIAKMFRQFRVSESDSDLQRILWRSNSNDELMEYQLLTVTYGTASAPFLSTRCIKQLALDNMQAYPIAADKLDRDTYVDDLMSGTDEDDDKAIQMVSELNSITSSACLSLRKWASNNPAVLQSLPEELRESSLPLSIDKEDDIKALGVKWNPASDIFSFNQIDLSARSSLTKRIVLSQLARVFDPLGFVSPVTISAKMFMQELWKSELGWDDKLSSALSNRWSIYCSNLQNIDQIKIPRWIKTIDTISMQLHAFCDASERAYGACVYLRCEKSDGTFSIKLLASKSRVAPLKNVSLPRLELCGAVLLTELFELVKESLKYNCELFAWTDSMIVLQWLESHPGRWQTFVANRVSTIQGRIPFQKWNHVKSADNPADLVSRGISALELANSDLWWNGPKWLYNSELPSRVTLSRSKDSKELEERRREAFSYHAEADQSVINNYSSLNKLKRVIAYCFRFILNCRSKTKVTGTLTPAELSRSLIGVIYSVQQHAFNREIISLKKGEPVQKSSCLSSLNPFIDGDNLIRVGGRLENSALPEYTKHQIIIPSSVHFTNILISEAHRFHGHGGNKLVWCYLRSVYWIVHARNSIRNVLRKCVVCRRQRAEKVTQLMGSFPSSRVTPTRAFQQCGVDYAGPFSLKTIKGRGGRVYKGYFCVFVCMATKAVHLELVSELTTAAFIATFTRFTSRRGLPSTIRSDCGTNFVGADKELRSYFKDDNNMKSISEHCSERGIQWEFNSPASPHHGGIFESAVKSVKYHLRRIIPSTTILTFEEFSTILCQVESYLNSRPLCAMSANPDDYDVLTPGHFLIGQPLTSIPLPDVTHLNTNRLSRWQLTQQIAQTFWKRWSSEYLSSLQQRWKWQRKQDNMSVGDLVVVHEDNLPPSKWKLGRIVETHAGNDGCVRIVTVKTTSGLIKRPIVKLTPILLISD